MSVLVYKKENDKIIQELVDPLSLESCLASGYTVDKSELMKKSEPKVKSKQSLKVKNSKANDD